MLEEGRYEKLPRPESIQALQRYLSSNPVVAKTELSKPQLLIVRRTDKPDLTIFLTNVYIVGEADVYEIFAIHRELNAIVTMSAWNGYTNKAKELCRARGVGLFEFKELLGAVYHTGEKFLDYEAPDERERKARNQL